MFSSFFIATVVSGGAAMWFYNKVSRGNGNKQDTLIAAIILWLVGLVGLVLLFRRLGI